MEDVTNDRPTWMNDEEYLIYQEMRMIFVKISTALFLRDLETWMRLTSRLRDLNREAQRRFTPAT